MYIYICTYFYGPFEGSSFLSRFNPLPGLITPLHPPWGYSFDVPYDPSNGTVSFGNLIKCQAAAEDALPFFP